MAVMRGEERKRGDGGFCDVREEDKFKRGDSSGVVQIRDRTSKKKMRIKNWS